MAFLQSLSVPVTLIAAIAIAAVLVYVPFLVVAYGRFQTGYDPGKPRALFDKLPAYAQRATWAHENSFESFMLFAAGALMAYVTQVTSPLAAGAAVSYVIARSLFSLFYILNLPLLRSMMFGVGSLAIATLMGLSIRQVL